MKTSGSVVIVGAGINGLVAANTLRRAGLQVSLLERKPVVGGACAAGRLTLAGRQLEYPTGATVLGMMPDFVYAETGLADRLVARVVEHPSIVHFESLEQPCVIHHDAKARARELSERWSERGDLAGFYRDFDRAAAFLAGGYRTGRVPTLEAAAAALGEETARLWIAGSARGLLDRYLTSDFSKQYFAMDVTESGPVSIDSPFSAFTLPLMSSGSVFGGRWGYVKGGLWRLLEELGDLDRELGVEVLTGARVVEVSGARGEVRFEREGRLDVRRGDHVLLATDPLTAARLLGDAALESAVRGKRMLGTSGKVVLFFRAPVRWKDETGRPGCDAAFRFIVSTDTLDAFERAGAAVTSGAIDYTPGYLEIYCEGAALRALGQQMDHDRVSVFFKHLALSRPGRDLPAVREDVETRVLARVENPRDFLGAVLFTPRDLQEEFFLPEGNIDHLELSEGQTFAHRSFSDDPGGDFYRLGGDPRVKLCAAGAYPCGSVAGTAGYMCARQLIDALGPPRAAMPRSL